jgi:hypothetical protein
MDIHREVNHILASLSQPLQLRFEFHQNGATVILCNSAGEHKYEMSLHELMTLERLFTICGKDSLLQMMQAGTVAYFTEEPQQ